MALSKFLILRCLAPPGTAHRDGRPGGGLALRDAAARRRPLRGRRALIQPRADLITASFAGTTELPRTDSTDPQAGSNGSRFRAPRAKVGLRSLQSVEQRLRLFEVGGVEPLFEPA